MKKNTDIDISIIASKISKLLSVPRALMQFTSTKPYWNRKSSSDRTWWDMVRHPELRVIFPASFWFSQQWMRGVSKWKEVEEVAVMLSMRKRFNKTQRQVGLQTIKSTNSAAAAGWSNTGPVSYRERHTNQCRHNPINLRHYSLSQRAVPR